MGGREGPTVPRQEVMEAGAGQRQAVGGGEGNEGPWGRWGQLPPSGQ